MGDVCASGRHLAHTPKNHPFLSRISYCSPKIRVMHINSHAPDVTMPSNILAQSPLFANVQPLFREDLAQ